MHHTGGVKLSIPYCHRQRRRFSPTRFICRGRRHGSFQHRSAADKRYSLVCTKPALFKPMVHSPAFTFSSVYSLGFCRVPGFAFGLRASFKPFWPLALVQQALPAIILQALRRLRGAVLFRGLRSSSISGFPFWLLGLTVQSSRPAFGGRLTFVR